MEKNIVPNISEMFKVGDPYIVVIKQLDVDEFCIQSSDIDVVSSVMNHKFTVHSLNTYSKNETVNVETAFFRTKLFNKMLNLLEQKSVSYSLIGMNNMQIRSSVLKSQQNQYINFMKVPVKLPKDFHHDTRYLYNPGCAVTSPQEYRIGTKKYKA